MRLIDADACEPYFYEHLDDNGMAGALNAIDEMPTIEPKKGKWIVYYECPRCGEITKDFTEYCPFCGADVRGEQND